LRSSGGSVIPPGASAVIADSVDEELVDYVSRGGRCLLFTRGAVIENTVRGDYADFRTIPWNKGNAGNLGTVITPHPALERYPHDGMCDLQFVWMVRGTLPMAFDPLRAYGVEPIIRGIDHYIANRNNAYMLEFKVGRGKVLATCLGILPKARDRLEARFLLQCLAEYVRSAAFKPDASVPKVVVNRLSLYLRELQRLEAAGQATISSGQLGALLGFSDAQVRKDLGFFGQFGYPGVGYRCDELIRAMRDILGSSSHELASNCVRGKCISGDHDDAQRLRLARAGPQSLHADRSVDNRQVRPQHPSQIRDRHV